MPDDDDRKYHAEVCDILREGVKNRDWFLWVNVNAPDDPRVSPPLDGLAEEVEEWLGDMKPDDQPVAPPTYLWEPGGVAGPGARVRLSAMAKKMQARGSSELIGNPVPAFAYWPGG